MITLIGYKPGENAACEVLSGPEQTMASRTNDTLVYFQSDAPVFVLDEAPTKSSFISAGQPPYVSESEA